MVGQCVLEIQVGRLQAQGLDQFLLGANQVAFLLVEEAQVVVNPGPVGHPV